MKKSKVLIGCLLFREFTGSEMYVYELSKNLKKLNCDVSIISPNVGGPLTELAINNGIKIYSFTNPPVNEKFDIIHGQHHPVVDALIKMFPYTPKICTIHSEVISLENPIQHPSIYRYIAIRPEIKEHLINKFGILDKQIEVIYNPIDDQRFNTENISDEGFTLFVGTIDYLRKNTIFDLVNYTKENNKKLCIVGKNTSDYLSVLTSYEHVEYHSDVYNVENFVKRCSETSGILLGRTTIEGWLCGKPGWIYDVDELGNIKSKNKFDPPEDVTKFKSSEVAKKVINEYQKILSL